MVSSPTAYHGILHVTLFLALIAGCDDTSTGTISGELESNAELLLISRTDREHDFGAVIGRPGLKLEHRYRLANVTGHDVKIVDVINRKTCCGIVRCAAADTQAWQRDRC